MISVIIPTYNRATFLPTTLQSVLNQTYPDFEIIVVDDGSTDNTEEVVSQIKDSRIKYFRKENGERGAARNFGVEKAINDYVTFLDSDDIFYQNHLERASEIITKQQPYPDIFHLSYEVVLPDRTPITKFNKPIDNVAQALLRGNLLSCAGMFVKRNILLEHKFSEDREFSATEDWHLWLVLSVRYNILYFPYVTSALVNHEARSVMSYNKSKLLYRTNKLCELLQNDQAFIDKHGIAGIIKIKSHMLTYSALHLAMSKKKYEAIELMLGCIKINPFELFHRRTLAIVKHLLL